LSLQIYLPEKFLLQPTSKEKMDSLRP
jgi:hypothetical protein